MELQKGSSTVKREPTVRHVQAAADAEVHIPSDEVWLKAVRASSICVVVLKHRAGVQRR
jgi:hypothetical protein